MRTEMVVCDCYKLLKDGKSFTKQGKVIKRSNVAVPRWYADEKNLNYKDTGLWYEKDEDATETFYEMKEKRRIEKKENAKVSGQLNEVLVDVIRKGTNVNAVDVDSEDVTELEKLKVKYKEKFGKKPFHSWGVDKLTEKLSE